MTKQKEHHKKQKGPARAINPDRSLLSNLFPDKFYSPPNLKFNPSATAVMLLLIFTS